MLALRQNVNYAQIWLHTVNNGFNLYIGFCCRKSRCVQGSVHSIAMQQMLSFHKMVSLLSFLFLPDEHSYSYFLNYSDFMFLSSRIKGPKRPMFIRMKRWIGSHGAFSIFDWQTSLHTEPWSWLVYFHNKGNVKSLFYIPPLCQTIVQ